MINKIEYEYSEGAENVDNKLATKDFQNQIAAAIDEINKQGGTLVVTTKAEGRFLFRIINITDELNEKVRKLHDPDPN
jgi:hypothetical protein